MYNFLFLIHTIYEVDIMKLRVDHCCFDMVKDLLMSADSLIQNVVKDGTTIIVTLCDGYNRDDFINFLSQDPLYRLFEFSKIQIM